MPEVTVEEINKAEDEIKSIKNDDLKKIKEEFDNCDLFDD